MVRQLSSNPKSDAIFSNGQGQSQSFRVVLFREIGKSRFVRELDSIGPNTKRINEIMHYLARIMLKIQQLCCLYRKL